MARPLLIAAVVVLASVHGVAIWVASDGTTGLTNGWPLWIDDHPLYYHSALVTRAFLWQTGTTAGYDPTFMSGYAKSVVFPASSTLPELVIAGFGGNHPDVAYKVYVLVCVAVLPWLVAVAAVLWRAGPGGTLGAVALFLVYLWSDFPINYATFGMLPYLLAIPLGLVATGAFVPYCERGGFGRWLTAALLMAGVVMVHFTSAMVVAPAAAVIYLSSLAGAKEGRAVFTWWRHLGVWMIPAVVIGVNAFWWLPGIWLASTKGPSDFAFVHPEGILVRLLQIALTKTRVERVLWVTGLLGLPLLFRSGRTRALGLLTFAAAGFYWGYVAAEFRTLDFLQPGRHTYALYAGLSVAGGIGLARGLSWLRRRSGVRLDVVAGLALVALGAWHLGPEISSSVRVRVLAPVPFLSSRPRSRLLWVLTRVRRFVQRGERLLYEEGGFDTPKAPEPFRRGRYSGLLPEALGIEVIGGPYLHAALTTNFTQFGEGKLFGRVDWDRDWFVKYARLYRPSAIVCWSTRAREFCRANPDLIEIKDDDGRVLIGCVKGFGGATIVGKADVKAAPGRLTVTGAEGGLDGTVVLRYHSVPCLRTDPPVAWDAVLLEDDPVPFIRLRPPFRPVVFALGFPPRGVRGGGPLTEGAQRAP